ncbi:hypothetical protein LCGC14_0305690 [marine sediment metagenome]|uniref:Uncharacterized protein n=1 Tax=marine sediment metagenome TaxID=412755 RepID=A0A0F9TNQ6_9ZZZZ
MSYKIKITEVEDYLDKNLKRNHLSLGFDVALHTTGIALLRTTNDFLIIEHTHKLITPKEAIEEKAEDIFTSQLDTYKNKIVQEYSLNSVVIENCFYGQNVKTLKGLARCSALARDRFKTISDECYYKFPKQIRKIINCNTGKLKAYQLKKYVVEYINAALNLQLKNKDHDIADAFACALVGLIDND